MTLEGQEVTTSEDVSSSSAPESSGQEMSSSAPVSTEVPTEGQPEAYTPNFKYKVVDKEFEFDEWLRPVVKSKEQESKLRELYEKATGIEEVKRFRDEIRNEYHQYKGNAEPVLKTINEATRQYQKGLKAFESGDAKTGYAYIADAFKSLGVDKKVLQQFVYTDLQMAEMPRDQVLAHQRQIQLERENEHYQQQLEAQQEYQAQVIRQARQSEIDIHLSKPEVSQIVQAFDQRNGPGAFKAEVNRIGQYHFATTGKDVGVQAAVNELVTKYGAFIQSQQPSQPGQMQLPQGAKPVIPSIKGGGAAPVKKKVRSLEDIEAEYNQI